MLWAMLYPLYSFKNVRNTHVGVLPLVKLQPPAAGYGTVHGQIWKGKVKYFLKGNGESKKRDCLKSGDKYPLRTMSSY